MFESVEAGQWEGVLQTSLDQYYDLRFIFGHRFCVSSTVHVQNTHRPYHQTQMGNCAHNAAAIAQLHRGYLESQLKTATIDYEKGAERRASVRGKKLKISEFFNWNRQCISPVNATLSYPCSHITQLTAEEREHMILQHILHLILIDLFLSKHEGKHIGLKLHIKMYFYSSKKSHTR